MVNKSFLKGNYGNDSYSVRYQKRSKKKKAVQYLLIADLKQKEYCKLLKSYDFETQFKNLFSFFGRF